MRLRVTPGLQTEFRRLRSTRAISSRSLARASGAPRAETERNPQPKESAMSNFAAISERDLIHVTGGAGAVDSWKNPDGRGVTVDWNKANQGQTRPPTDGVFPYNGGDGTKGHGGWAIA
jgi:hypothetical protein